MKHGSGVHPRPDSGFTLVELLIALGLGSVVLGIMVAFFMTLTRSSIAQNAAALAQHSARAGVEHIVNDLRVAGLDPLKTAGAGIAEISSPGSKLRFTSDRCDQPINSSGCDKPAPDGDVADQSEEVTYVYDAGRRAIRRCFYESDPSRTTCVNLIEKVVPNPDGIPLFTFLDGENNEVTDNLERSRIRTVILTLTIEEPAGIRKAMSRTYSSRVSLRNIGL
jgi:prepilin-type N-terminal cleavage/methylation domain-containing protein